MYYNIFQIATNFFAFDEKCCPSSSLKVTFKTKNCCWRERSDFLVIIRSVYVSSLSEYSPLLLLSLITYNSTLPQPGYLHNSVMVPSILTECFVYLPQTECNVNIYFPLHSPTIVFPFAIPFSAPIRYLITVPLFAISLSRSVSCIRSLRNYRAKRVAHRKRLNSGE